MVEFAGLIKLLDDVPDLKTLTLRDLFVTMWRKTTVFTMALLALGQLTVNLLAVENAATLSPQNGFSKDKPASGPAVPVEGGYLVPYKLAIPGSSVTFEMIPIPGGVVQMGSPAGSEGAKPDESPQVKVAVEPMWVAKTEVSWAEYKLFMSMYRLFKKFEQDKIRKVDGDTLSKALTAPTQLYEPTSLTNMAKNQNNQRSPLLNMQPSSTPNGSAD